MDIHSIAVKLRHWQTAALLLFFVLLPFLAPVVEMQKMLNTIALIIIFLLFAGCVWLIPADQLSGFYRFAIGVFFFGFLLNTCYELMHSVFYTHFTEPGYTYLELVVMLFGSAIADGFISLALLFAVSVFRRGRWDWAYPWAWRNVLFLILLAFGVQTTGEVVALKTGAWAYNEAMPLVPVLHVGLTPVLQMPLLILPTFWFAWRVACLPIGGSSEHSAHP
jgi:hypothetical protein